MISVVISLVIFFFLISDQGVSDNKSQTEENIFALFKGG